MSRLVVPLLYSLVLAGAFAPIGTFDHWGHKGWGWIINSSADWGHAMELINHEHWDHSMQAHDAC